MKTEITGRKKMIQVITRLIDFSIYFQVSPKVNLPSNSTWTIQVTDEGDNIKILRYSIKEKE